MLGDEFELFLEDGAGAVAGEDEEGAEGPLFCVEVFVEASGCGGGGGGCYLCDGI